MKTVLINMRYDKCDVPIDRTTIFGNPYDHRKLGITREESVKKYREWFYQRIKDDSFRQAVEGLRGKRIGCWCVPDLCHGHVLIEYLEGTPMPFTPTKNIITSDSFGFE